MVVRQRDRQMEDIVDTAAEDAGGVPVPTPVSIAPAAVPAPVAPVAPRVSLRVFEATSGVRPERMAGFARKVRGQEPQRRTILEWRQAFQDYLRSPVK